VSNTFTYHASVFFDELDALGVLHHTRYLLHLERAQQQFFQDLLGVDDFDAQRDEDIYVVVHSIESRFREPFRTPGQISVHYTINRIRSGGVTMAFKITSADESKTFCDGIRTVCKLSAETHQPVPWTEPFRQAMEAHQVGELAI
jgi:acyl-CoA thioester hydrolase